MTREEVEDQIRALLSSESMAMRLSNKLFTPGGLFSQIAQTPEERREIANSDLWKQAISRLDELHEQESAALAEAAEVIRRRLPNGSYRLRLEAAELIESGGHLTPGRPSAGTPPTPR
jgi:hypothetical protein